MFAGVCFIFMWPKKQLLLVIQIICDVLRLDKTPLSVFTTDKSYYLNP